MALIQLYKLSLIFLLLIPIVYSTYEFGYIDGAMWHDDGLVYDRWGDSIRVRKLFKPLYDMSFSMTSLSLTPTTSTKDFNWEWEHYSYSFDWDYINSTMPFFKNNDTNWVNDTRETYIFTGRNNDPAHNWTIEINFTEGQNIKMTHTLVVGSLVLMSPKFKYRFDYYDMPYVKYNNQIVDLSLGQTYDISPSLSPLPTRLETGTYSSFIFKDLVDTGNTISNVYIGNGYTTIEAEPPRAFYRRGETIILDPQSTGYTFPTMCGDPLNQWTNCANVMASDNTYATETTAGEMFDTGYYGFDIEGYWTPINYISVRIESNAGACPE